MGGRNCHTDGFGTRGHTGKEALALGDPRSHQACAFPRSATVGDGALVLCPAGSGLADPGRAGSLGRVQQIDVRGCPELGERRGFG